MVFNPPRVAPGDHLQVHDAVEIAKNVWEDFLDQESRQIIDPPDRGGSKLLIPDRVGGSMISA